MNDAVRPPGLPPPGGGPVPSQERLEAVRDAEHPRCFACSPSNALGLRLRFRVQEDGSVLAFFPCREVFQSYPETLHGGIISALLDAAMTNALFSIGVVGVTAELSVRFLAPVRLEHGAVVRGRIERTNAHPLYDLSAGLLQDRTLAARATARFLVRDCR